MDVTFPQGVTLTTKEFLRDKRDVAKRFVAAYFDGLDVFLKNPQVGKKALARFTGVKEERLLDADYAQYTEKYLNKSFVTEPRALAIVFDRIGVAAAEEREKLFQGLVDNSVIAEARALRGASPR
jgi:ABC-type nitrate/sulfonate/bicarbonate transport system substrate-binding protein